MKQTLLFALLVFATAFVAKSQIAATVTDSEKVIVDNNRIKVTEYVSSPGNDICGKGKHSHEAHLSILLTDAKVKVATADGKTQHHDLKAGAAFWSEAETHTAVNVGTNIAKAYLVEVK